jgi:hypothetical protein
MPTSPYVLQLASKTRCPQCHQPTDLLIRRNGTISSAAPAFYICYGCRLVVHVGRAVVDRDET